MQEAFTLPFLERLKARELSADLSDKKLRGLPIEEIHTRLAVAIGRTPIRVIPLENDNVLIQKNETKNPTETHYDRCYEPLLKELFRGKRVKRGSILLETSSGSAGISFAWMCSRLGYRAHVFMPDFVPEPRIQATMALAEEVHLNASRSDYLLASAREMRRHYDDIKEKRLSKRPSPCMPNHSQDPRVPSYFEPIADELIRQTQRPIDYFIGGIGNGSTLLGVGRRVKHYWPEAKVIGFEPTAACPNYRAHQSRWGSVVRIGDDQEIPREWHFHRTPGLGSFGNIRFPFTAEAIQSGVVDDICHVPDSKILAQLDYNTGVPDRAQFGSSTLLARFIAEQMAKQVRGKVFFTLAYDRADRY